MGCVQPPLSAKPSRGYGWTCAPCSRRHEEEVDSHEVIRHSTPSNNKPKAPSRARGPGRPRKDRKLAEQEENAPIKHFGMWPFRYFGSASTVGSFFDDRVLIRDGYAFSPQNPHCSGRHPGSVHSRPAPATFLIGNIADPNDFIFPRIATRTGLKFQAIVPAAPDSTPIPGMGDQVVCCE